jgi:hypothetical protein
MKTFSTYWKTIAKASAACATLVGLGIVLHGGATAYASTASVKALEVRIGYVEASQTKVESKLDSVDQKLDLAIELLRSPGCR